MKSRFWIIGMCAFGLSACGIQAPLDDAYHWEDRAPKHSTSSKTSTTSTTGTASAPSTTSQTSQTSEPKPAEPTLEFVNVQDTTITVKIYR